MSSPPVGYGRTPPLGIRPSPHTSPSPISEREAAARATEWLYDWIEQDPGARAGTVADEQRWAEMQAAATRLFRADIMGIELLVTADGSGYTARLVGYRDPQSGVYQLRYGPGGVGTPCGALLILAEELGLR